MSYALHSRIDPGAYPTVAVVPGPDGTRAIVVGCRIAGRTCLVRYAPDLTSRLETEVTVPSVSDPPQHFEDSRFLAWQMIDGPVWPRWEIDLAELDPAWRDTGIRDAAGNPEARDGHVLSGGTAQHQAHHYDGQPLTFPAGFEPGEGEIAGDWILFRDHSNRRLARSKDAGATWDVLDVPNLPTANDGVFEAAINSWGDVFYSPSGGQPTQHWNEPTGVAALAPSWLQDGAAWAETPYCATCLYHAPTSRFFVYLRNAEGLALTFERLNQWTWARYAWLDEHHVVLVTFAYDQMSIDVVDMRQPFEFPVEPTVDPPDPPDPPNPPNPPQEDDMTVAECKVLLDQMEQRLNAKIAQCAQVSDTSALMQQELKLEQLARAQRDTTMGGVFGTNVGTIKPNLKP